MTSDRILIIDDKGSDEKDSSGSAIRQLSKDQKALVAYHRNSEGLWEEKGDDVRLLVDFSGYPFIFIHDSYDNPIILGGLKEVLIEKLSPTSTVVLLSGTKPENSDPVKAEIDGLCWYEVRRVQYLDNLSRFIDSKAVFGSFQLKYLYDRYRDPKKDKCIILSDDIRVHLEESVYKAARSEPFLQLLTLLGHEDHVKRISERFSKLTDEEFLRSLEELIENS